MDSFSAILDLDPGVDDALAIMLALASPELEVVGITTVNGNVPLSMGKRNTLRVLELLKRTKIPVYSGSDRPLLRDPVYALEIHGLEGLGEAFLPDPDVQLAGDGIKFLIETLSACPGEIVLIATGPLTNLALAEQCSPGILSQARKVVVMGGVLEGSGNVTPSAEFNFFVDPEAARKVIRSEAPVLLVPLNITRQVGLDKGRIKAQVMPLKTEKSQFIEAAVQTAIAYSEKGGGYAGIYLHDPVAVGVTIVPGFFRTEPVLLDVETAGELTVGQVVVDRRLGVPESKRKGFWVECVVEVDGEKFLNLFLKRVLEL